jgi:putative ATP-dependent endonuclease of OLD family
MYISRVRIENYRNFRQLDISLDQHTVIVGSNKAGKTNLIKAIQLAIDPNLTPNARRLQGNDFFDGEPSFNGRKIIVQVEIALENHETTCMYSMAAMVSKKGEPHRARFTYRFEPDPLKIPQLNDSSDDEEIEETVKSYLPTQYRYVWFPGEKEDETVNPNKLSQYLDFTLLHALRDTHDLLSNWSRSPLRTLLENANIRRELLQDTATRIRSQVEPLGREIQPLVTNVENRSTLMVGNIFTVGSSLNVVTDEPDDLLRTVNLYVDGSKQRNLGQASLGTLNILYLSLLLEESHQNYLKRQRLEEDRNKKQVLEQQELPEMVSKASSVPEQQLILALEEPEAHIHPHVQRSIFRYFLSDESAIKSLLVTTHSPHIASVAGIDRVVVLRSEDTLAGTKGHRVETGLFEDWEKDDINRYLDVTRGELLFARGVIFVEGTAELYIIPAFAKAMNLNLDHLGISVISVQGTDFAPFVKLVSERGYSIPFAVLTDGDKDSRLDDDDELIGASLSRGEKRGIGIASVALNTVFKIENGMSASDALRVQGIFVGEYTLEVDLLPFYEQEMVQTYSDLVRSDTARTAFEAGIEAAKSGETEEFLRRITRKGKGRFAQKLAPVMVSDRCPEYIRCCLEYIRAKVKPLTISTPTASESKEQYDGKSL